MVQGMLCLFSYWGTRGLLVGSLGALSLRCSTRVENS